MSVESCNAFLERVQSDPDFGEWMRAITDTRELVALGNRSGYAFEVEDLTNAFAGLSEQDESATLPLEVEDAPVPGDEDVAVYHYELEVPAVPELRPLLDELPHLTIKPATVDLERFAGAFRREDLEWTETSPASPGFRERYEAVMVPQWSGGGTDWQSRRDFHLINLDQHVDDPLYESYFEAKVRTVGHLSKVFGSDVRFSGSMWYPPFSYRLWHTNQTQPGWRMYLIDFDEPIAASDTRSVFRYMNPRTRELVSLQDRPKLLRFFKIEQGEGQLFWHCIVNSAPRSRWSFGFAVPDGWMSRLRAATSGQVI